MQSIASATFYRLHLDELENQIVSLSARINASEHEFLVQRREFDLRQGWKAWGCTDCATWLSLTRNADGSMSFTIDLPGEQGELVMKAIEFAMSEDQIVNDESLFARQVDALVSIARNYLAGGEQGKSSSADNYQVMVHVDESALKNEGGASDLPIESIRRLTCDGSVVLVIQDEWCFQRPNGRAIPLGQIYRENVSAETFGVEISRLADSYVSAETIQQGGRIEEPFIGYG